jgi:hypothetical protein
VGLSALCRTYVSYLSPQGSNLATTMLISGSGATYPKVAEYSVSGGAIGFNTSDPVSLLPVYVVGILLITGYFYLRRGSISPELNHSESPSV